MFSKALATRRLFLSASSSIRRTPTITSLGSIPQQCREMLSPTLQSWFSSSAQATTTKPVQFLYLNNLHDNPGAVKKKKRVGRGNGSGRGKTCGRGQKGQKARSGSSIPAWFEGGQTPLHKRLPKRGFKSKKKKPIALNLGTVLDHVAMGRLPGVGDSELNPINMWHMIEAGMITPNTTLKRGGIKLLAQGKERIDTPLHLLVGWASKEAIAAVERAGGTVTTFHYNKLALREHVRGPDKYKHRQARPPPKYQPYYTSMHCRGYLHPGMQLRKWFLDPANQHLKAKFDELIKENKENRVQTETGED